MYAVNQGFMSRSTYQLEYGRPVARRRRRRHAYAPSSNTTSHDDHEESYSWVPMSTYGAAVGAAWAAGAPLQRDNKGILHMVLKRVKNVRSRYNRDTHYAALCLYFFFL